MKKNINLAGLVIGILILFTACNIKDSGAYKEKFTSTNFDKITRKFADDKTVPTEDIAMLTNALKRLSIYKDSIVGKTIGEVITNEERYVRDYSKSQLIATSTVAMVRVGTENKFIGILPDKNPAGQEINNLYFAFSNKLSKQIKSFAGELVFYYRNTPKTAPMQLKAIPFSFANPISAGAKDTLIFYEPYSESDNLAVLLRTQTAKISGYINILQVNFK